MRFPALAFLILAAIPLPALAQSWSAGEAGVALLPTPASGPAADGAALACLGGAWSLTIPGASGAVAMLVDGKLFPGNAEGGTIALPTEAIEALKAGSKFTLNIGGTEWAFGLKGSGRAIEAASASCPVVAPPEPIAMTAPPSVEAMTQVPIAFTGTVSKGDWIAFAVPGSPGAEYVPNAWTYAEGANPAIVPTPGTPGTYELRYLKTDYTILVALPVEVTPTTKAPPAPVALTVTLPVLTVKAGAAFEVTLGADAPRGADEYVYIVPAGAPEQDYSGGFTLVPATGPVAMTAPTMPGTWELRYMVPRGEGVYAMIGQSLLTVE
jgi:hypothetical protein